MTAETTGSGEVGPGRGGRMSRQRKAAAVLRPLRGEDLETVSRALGVTAATLSGWRDALLAAGEAILATRPGTGDEPDDPTRRRQAPRSGRGLPGLGPRALDRLPASGAAASGAPAAPRAGRADAGRRTR